MFGCPLCQTNRRAFLGGSFAAAASLAGVAAAAPPPGAPIVDFHTHMADPVTLATSGVMQVGAEREAALLKPEVHLERMRRLGVARHVILPAGAIQGVSWGDARQDLEINKRINDRVAEFWVGRAPDRFIGGFGLPTQDLKLALPELERMANTPGMRVLQVSSHTPDKIYYGDPSLDPLLEALQHFGIMLFIHPHLQMKDPPLDQYGLFNSIGQGIEEAKVMGNIIFQGVFEKFPRLKIMVAHGGGFLPHYPGRMDRNVGNMPGIGRNLKAPPSAYVKRFYFDSCVYSQTVLSALVKAVGSDRVVLGGDYPLGSPDPMSDVRQAPDLTAADVAAILSGNAASILGA